MNLVDIREFCLSLPFATEDTPFDDSTLCFRIGRKIFALTDLEKLPLSINLKCVPEIAQRLREKYSSIKPGYHMNKLHWNTIIIDGELSDKFIKQMIAHSYTIIFDSLPKKTKKELMEENKEIALILDDGKALDC